VAEVTLTALAGLVSSGGSSEIVPDCGGPSGKTVAAVTVKLPKGPRGRSTPRRRPIAAAAPGRQNRLAPRSWAAPRARSIVAAAAVGSRSKI
jgi:hypothetical protein